MMSDDNSDEPEKGWMLFVFVYIEFFVVVGFCFFVVVVCCCVGAKKLRSHLKE